MSDEKNISDISHVEANGNFDRSWRDEDWGNNRNLSVAAEVVAVKEKEMTIRQAINAYPMAIFWSLIISTCVIMEGYDTNLLGNFYAYPSFQTKYGNFVGVTKQTPTGYSLTAGWQSGLGQGSGECLPGERESLPNTDQGAVRLWEQSSTAGLLRRSVPSASSFAPSAS